MEIFKGKKGASGTAVGPVLLWKKKQQEITKQQIVNVTDEEKRFDEALKQTVDIYKDLIEHSDVLTAEILEAQLMMLQEKEFISEIQGLIRNEKVNAEFAVFKVGNDQAKKLECIENEYIKTRVTDIRNVTHKLIAQLSGNIDKLELKVPSIIVTEEITPEDISTIDHSLVVAFVTHLGNKTSHSAILAGNYGIPYLFGIEIDNIDFSNVKLAAVDTDTEQFILSPDDETLKWLQAKIQSNKMLQTAPENYCANVKIYANIAKPEDVVYAKKYGADGIGLYRTEFLYMNRETLPGEEEQFEAYKSVLEQMADREVIIRTMDVGADKPSKCLNMVEEKNPALGHRGIRICLDNPEIFRTQLRALLRAACFGQELIMFPMIASPREIDETREQIKIAARELTERGMKYRIPPIGIMVETPSAAILSKELAEKVDFLSIGTNDLIQYTLAFDRQCEGSERFCQADLGAVMKLIEETIRNAHEAGITVGICGELAGEPDVIPQLIEMGVDELSMSPPKIPVAKNIIMQMKEAEAEDISELLGIKETVIAPAEGKIVLMKDIPDSTFAQGIMGKCIGIETKSGIIYAPCDGVVTTVAKTKHAIGIKSELGTEYLIHVGIDTVTLNGNGFECFTEPEQTIKKGQKILVADLDLIHKNGLSATTILAVTGFQKEDIPEKKTACETEKKKPEGTVMNFFQSLGRSMMLPVGFLPVCAILVGLGYLLCPQMIQGGEITGFQGLCGGLLIKAGSAIIEHMALLFAIGVGVGMSEHNDGIGGIAAIISWFIITTMLSAETVTQLIPYVAKHKQLILAYQKIANPFVGILAGLIGANCYNRFKGMKLPDVFSFFSGKRFVAIAASIESIVFAALLLIVWPLLFSGLIALGKTIVSLDAVGAGIYSFLNRALIPFGMHHALNNVFWFDTIGLGDLIHFWAGKTSKDVTWSLGMYMSGFFPCMMFGIPGAALAMIQCANKNKKKLAIGLLGSTALCSFLCGVTEPFEFSFMFLAPTLYLIYALLYGIITVITVMVGFRAGFCFSAGATDLFFSASLPAAQNTWMIIPLGAFTFVVFYATFYFFIKKRNLKTPGREDDVANVTEGIRQISASEERYTDMARIILQGVGGKENISRVENCVTRLRFELKDLSIVDENIIRNAGIAGIMRLGQNALQVVVGTQVQFVADALHDILNRNEITCFIKSKVGIHARPAGALVKRIQQSNCKVWMTVKGKTVLADSIVNILTLDAQYQSEVTFRVEGPDANEIHKLLKDIQDLEL